MSKNKPKRSDRQAAQLASLSAHEVAHFLSSYVYGNILILAALIGITPEDIHHGHGALLVLGTGFATLLAHVLAESQELLVLRKADDTREEFVSSLKIAVKDARPIFSATLFPALVLFLAQAHVLDATIAWWVSVVVIVSRMLRNGAVIAKYRGEEITPRTRLLNIVFALVCLAVAIIKVKLTH